MCVKRPKPEPKCRKCGDKGKVSDEHGPEFCDCISGQLRRKKLLDLIGVIK